MYVYILTDSYGNLLATSTKLYGMKHFLKKNIEEFPEILKQGDKWFLKEYVLYRARIGHPTGTYGIPEKMDDEYVTELVKGVI